MIRESLTINLKPEDEKLIRKRIQSGVFASAEEVFHRALESLEAEEDWLQENRAAINEQIERGATQLERGEGLSREQSQALLEAKKTAWRAEQQRG